MEVRGRSRNFRKKKVKREGGGGVQMARNMGECRIWEGVWQEKKIWEETKSEQLRAFLYWEARQAVFTVRRIGRLYQKQQN